MLPYDVSACKAATGNDQDHMPKAITSEEIARRQAVGRRVVQALESVELTQSDLARRVKVPPGNFSRMLRGERLLAPYLGRIARLCNVSMAWLLGGGKGGPGAIGDRRGHGRRPNSDRFLRQLSPSEREALLLRAREAWLLPRTMATRVLTSTVRAARERTSTDETKGDHVLLVVVRMPKRST